MRKHGESAIEHAARYRHATAKQHPFGGNRPGEPWHNADRVLEELRAQPVEPRHCSVAIAGRMLNEGTRVPFKVDVFRGVVETKKDWAGMWTPGAFRFDQWSA